MATALALVGYNWHNFNSDLNLQYIVSLQENGSRPHIIVTNKSGEQVGDVFFPDLKNTFDKMMEAIAVVILNHTDPDTVASIQSDIQIHVIRMSSSCMRLKNDYLEKYSGFKGLRFYQETK